MTNQVPLSPPVQWDLFTDDERREVQKMMDRGFYSDLAALPILVLDPAKEAEVKRIQTHYSPSVSGYESKVRTKLDKLVASGKVNLDDPTVEMEWHNRLLDERKKWQEEQKEKAEREMEKETERRKPGRSKKDEVIP